jgi:hypothetical protein
MRRRSIVCLYVAAAGFVLVAAAPSKRKPEPGFACKIEHRGDFGVITTDFQIFDSGVASASYIKWDAGRGTFANPWITAAFFHRKDGSYALGYGYVSIMRHIWEHRPGRQPRPLKLSLELTTHPILAFGAVRMAGPLERSGGPFHLELDWGDAAALAKGSTHLYLVARNARRDVMDQVEIDRTIFARAEPHIVAAFAEAEAMARRPAEFCTHSDDLGTDDIVIT